MFHVSRCLIKHAPTKAKNDLMHQEVLQEAAEEPQEVVEAAVDVVPNKTVLP